MKQHKDALPCHIVVGGLVVSFAGFNGLTGAVNERTERAVAGQGGEIGDRDGLALAR